jgi:hypothetical protein
MKSDEIHWSVGYGNKGCWVMSDNWLKAAGYHKQPQSLNTPTARLFPITSGLEPIALSITDCGERLANMAEHHSMRAS